MQEILIADKNKQIRVELSTTNDIIDSKDLNHTISNIDIFENEKEISNSYRVLGEINIYGSNVLMNKTGVNSYDEIKGLEFDLNEKLLEEKNGWYYYYQNNVKTFLNPTPNYFSLDGFDLLLLYPHSYNDKDILLNNISIDNGIAVHLQGTTIYNKKEVTYFVTSIAHNLKKGDQIQILIDGQYKREFIYDVGFEDGSYSENIFLINKKYSFITINNIVFNKIINDKPVEYKSLWLKRLTNINDFDVFTKRIGVNIYGDKSLSFICNKDINQSDFTPLDNYNVLFLNVLKKKNDGVFSNIISGLETFLMGVNYDSNMIYSGGTIPEIEENINNTDELFFGGIVEISNNLINIISEPVYVFNTNNRLTNLLNEGYMYKPQKTIYFDKKNFKNGLSYLNTNVNLFINRQDPCDFFGIGNNALIKGNCQNYKTFIKNVKYNC